MNEVFPKFHQTKFHKYCEMMDTNSDFGGGSDFGSSPTATGMSSSGTNNDSLAIAIGGDVTKLGTAFIAEQGAVSTAKAVSRSPNASVLVYGGVAIAALIVIFLLLKK